MIERRKTARGEIAVPKSIADEVSIQDGNVLRKHLSPRRTPLGDVIYVCREYNSQTKLEIEHITLQCSASLEQISCTPGLELERIRRRY